MTDRPSQRTAFGRAGHGVYRYAEYMSRRFQQWRRYTLPVPKLHRPIALPHVARAGGGEVNVVAICKDEGPYVREWVEFHRNVGFDRFQIYDNGSTDETLDILAELARDGDIDVVPWPDFYKGHDAQVLAYHHAMAAIGARSKWIAFIDLDEFLFPLESRPIAEILKDYDELPALSLPWTNYSSGGHRTRPSGRVTENYLQRTPFPPSIAKNALLNYKSIVRPEFTAALSKHFPEIIGEPAYFYTERKERVHKGDYINPKYASSEVFRLNHYFGKSTEEFMAKVTRGPISRRHRSRRKTERYLMIEEETVFDDAAARKWETFRPRPVVAARAGKFRAAG